MSCLENNVCNVSYIVLTFMSMNIGHVVRLSISGYRG